jgi:hypothetical protein
MRSNAGERIYFNSLSNPADVAGWRMEGDGVVTFPVGRMRLESTRDAKEGQAANVVFWCPQVFPDRISISWDFYPLYEPGLAILFFAAKGRNGQSVLDPSLARRSGPYEQYHSGDINALHVSYFRRKFANVRAFTTCNLRKSHGFHLVAQGADPIPSMPDVIPPYHMSLVKDGARVRFAIGHGDERVECFDWTDDGASFGDVLSDGMIGFRHQAPLIAEYANLEVRRLA